MDYEKAYKQALERARKLYEQGTITESLGHVFPELKEFEGERIRKGLIKYFKNFNSESLYTVGLNEGEIISWLEKQGDNNEIAKDILRGAAIHLITWIDYHATEGNMCLSNMECKDIENALVNADWNKIYTYMKKKLEKAR